MMKRLLTSITLALLLAPLSAVCAPRVAAANDDPKTTAAYSVLVMRKAAIEADLEELLRDCDESCLETKSKRFEYEALVRQMKRVSEMPEASAPKLTSAYGTLLLREAALESKLQSLLLEYTEGWPEVKKTKAELAALQRELKDIMR